MSANVALRQRLQQCLGLLQVGRVKPLGEPAVDRGQELVGFRTLALALPETTEAHGGPQLQRFRLLVAGDVEGLVKTGLRLSILLRGEREQQLPLESM